MSEDSAFERLSPELQQQILLQSDTLDTLYALIRASPRLYQVFRLNKETILSTIALCQFHPAVQPEAMAIAKLEQQQHHSKPGTQSQRDISLSFCDTFPNQIYRWCEANALGPVSADLCKLDGTIQFFIKDYGRNTLPVLDQLGQSQDLRILPEYRSYNHIPQPQLSLTETGRLQRALCRFEVYRCLFSRCSHDHHGIHKCLIDPPLTTGEQAKVFLQDLPGFQVDEIACIRDYLVRRLRGIYDELENQAVRTLPVEALTFEEFDESAMWRSPFFLFTTQAQHQQQDHLEHLLSLGLPYIRQILESSGEEQRDLFLHHVRGSVVDHLERDFLSKALQCLGLNPNIISDRNAWLGIEKEFTPACDENGYSELPQGWLWGYYHLEPSKYAHPAYKGLRDWGYVFWDYDRLQESGILRRDPNEVRKICFSDYHGRHKPSVEQRLHALCPSVNDPEYGSDGQESFSSMDEFIDWDADDLVLGSH
ncbi:MAG: hypothetical protein Q9175_003794 [Cornicularia normoerica]